MSDSTIDPTMAYRVLTPRLEIRCYSPADAASLADAMAAGVEHLKPWMPWARHEPQSFDEKVALLRRFRSRFDADEDWTVGAFDRARPALLLGGSGLHRRIGPGAAEIGYWVRAGHEGKGLATEIAGALTRVGFDCLLLDRIEIRCDARNLASARVARKLGFREEGRLRGVSTEATEGPGDRLVFGILRGEFPASPAASIPVEAFDSVGRSLGLSATAG